jgi:hypothetical protein
VRFLGKKIYLIEKYKMEPSYYFVFEVREGERGFADDDTYTSAYFNSLEDCYREMRDLNPKHRWRHLRYVKKR